MKNMSKLVFMLGLLTAPPMMKAAGFDWDALMDEADEAKKTQFETTVGKLLELSLEGKALAFIDRLAYLPGHGVRRPNPTMDEPAIDELYKLIRDLYDSIQAMQHVGKCDQDLVTALSEKLTRITATFPTLESGNLLDPNTALYGSRGDFSATTEFLNTHLSDRNPLRTLFSVWAYKIQAFFSVEANKEGMSGFAGRLLQELSQKAKPNSSKTTNDRIQQFNGNRMFAYHMAIKAGYDTPTLINDVFDEMQECSQGPIEINQCANVVLIHDIQPLLLGQELLENESVLDGYLLGIKALAYVFSKGQKGIQSNYSAAYGDGDTTYKELQRVYNSLQFHIMRLRIDKAIIPALQGEIGNRDALARAEEEQALLKERQDNQRIESVVLEVRPALMASSVEILVKQGFASLDQLIETAGNFDSAPSSTDTVAVISGIVVDCKGRVVAIVDDFKEKAPTLGAIPLAGFYRETKGNINKVITDAKKAIETPIRDRMAAINALEEGRAAKLSASMLRNINVEGPQRSAKDYEGLIKAGAELTGLSGEAMEVIANLRRSNMVAQTEAASEVRVEKVDLRDVGALDAVREATKERAVGGGASVDEAALQATSLRRAAAQSIDVNQARYVSAVVAALKEIAKAKGPGRFGTINTAGNNASVKAAVSKLDASGWQALLDQAGGESTAISLLQEALDKEKISADSLVMICKELGITKQ